MLRFVRRRRLLLTGPDASAGVLFFVDRRFDVPYRSADCLEIPRVDHAGDVPGVENGVESGVDSDAVNVAMLVSSFHTPDSHWHLFIRNCYELFFNQSLKNNSCSVETVVYRCYCVTLIAY